MAVSDRLLVETPAGFPADVRAYLARDAVRNAYATELLEHHRADVHLWTVRDGGEVVAHLAAHRLVDVNVNWGYLSGSPAGAAQLLDALPRERALVLADAALGELVRSALPSAREFPETILEVDRDRARLVDPSPAVRLGPEVAEAYARLVVPPSLPLTPTMLERNRRHLADGVVYGVFDRGELVSVAGAIVRGPNAWVVSGVETLERFRRRGHALRVTSAVTRDGLGEAPRVGLWVRDDNPGARALYERLGYRATGASTWFDVGTGFEP